LSSTKKNKILKLFLKVDVNVFQQRIRSQVTGNPAGTQPALPNIKIPAGNANSPPAGI
jgi:hypothetical protein